VEARARFRSIAAGCSPDQQADVTASDSASIPKNSGKPCCPAQSALSSNNATSRFIGITTALEFGAGRAHSCRGIELGGA
jgi:hypothetical protein